MSELLDRQTDAGDRSTTNEAASAARGPSPAEPAEPAAEIERRDSGAWAVAAALAIGGVGLAAGSPLLVAAATLPLWFVAAAALGSRPVTALRIERRVSVGSSPGRSGDPGDAVTVTTAVTNVGEGPVVDARVADGVPADLPVVDGSPRASVSLSAGATTTFEYELELRRGEHAFGDATVEALDLTGTVTGARSVPVTGDDVATCTPAVESVPLGSGTNDYAGQVPTDEGGTGTEFYAVRDYEPGDPVGSIDWRRYAATRDLATVEYRAERSTRIVCVVDARASQFLTSPGSHLQAVDLSAAAARRTIATLTAAGHPTGLVTLSESDLSMVPPGIDAATRERTTDLLEGVTDDPGHSRTLSWHGSEAPTASLASRLPGEAQVYLFTSAVDDAPREVVESLRARDYAVRVVSPDVTEPAADLGTRLTAVARDSRLAGMRASGARVIDWHLDRPLAIVLREAVGEVAVR